MKNQIKISLPQLLVIVGISSIILSLVTGSLVYGKLNTTGKVTTTNNKYINQFINTYNKLLDEYYEDLDENELVDAAINGMLNYTGDDYTIYMDEDATYSLNERLTGTYEGVGIVIKTNENEQIFIDEVLDNSPASEAGLQPDDIILSINDNDLSGKDLAYATSLVKTDESTIKFKILRGEEEKEFTIEKKVLIQPALTSSIKEYNGKKVGYMYLEAFSDTLDVQVESTLLSMEKEGIDSLIIDLRGNTGGYLNSCTNIVELFLKKNALMYSIKSKTKTTDYKDTTETSRNYPIVVLINGATASASEILASSLKYSYGATLVGTKSYGKGKVQTTGKLDDGTMIKYTSAKWYTSNGDCIDEIGLKPDVEVKLDENFLNNPIEENDNQINEALRILTE